MLEKPPLFLPKLFLVGNYFKLKIFSEKTSKSFFADLLQSKKWFEKYFLAFGSYVQLPNIFFYIFSYNLRNYKKEKEIPKKSCGERSCVRIEGFRVWIWNSVQLLVNITCNLAKQLWEDYCGAHLFGHARNMLWQVDPIKGFLTISYSRAWENSKKWFMQIRNVNHFMHHEYYFS